MSNKSSSKLFPGKHGLVIKGRHDGVFSKLAAVEGGLRLLRTALGLKCQEHQAHARRVWPAALRPRHLHAGQLAVLALNLITDIIDDVLVLIVVYQILLCNLDSTAASEQVSALTWLEQM